MGTLLDGVWTEEAASPVTSPADGAYRRPESMLRNWITPDGAAGPVGGADFKAEAGRYHLYIAINCRWAHRTWMLRKLTGLEDAVSMSIVLPRRSDQGWVFDEPTSRYGDPVLGAKSLHEIYVRAQPSYSGRVTVPVLWDKARETIVNNESSEIIRMFNGAFAGIANDATDHYPPAHRAEIDSWNAIIYETVNNGVYRAGFARTQEAYERAFDALFATFERIEARLSTQRYLCGERPTEADWRLFPTLARFDSAYHGAFKCNLHRLVDYANLWPYTRDLYQIPGIAETVDVDIYKRGYYSMSGARSPLGIVPKGPAIDFTAAHGRGV